MLDYVHRLHPPIAGTKFVTSARVRLQTRTTCVIACQTHLSCAGVSWTVVTGAKPMILESIYTWSKLEPCILELCGIAFTSNHLLE